MKQSQNFYFTHFQAIKLLWKNIRNPNRQKVKKYQIWGDPAWPSGLASPRGERRDAQQAYANRLF